MFSWLFTCEKVRIFFPTSLCGVLALVLPPSFSINLSINFLLSTCLVNLSLVHQQSTSLYQLVFITLICLFYQSTSFYQRLLLSINLSLFYQRQLISINLSLSHSFAFSINQLPSINVNFFPSTCLYHINMPFLSDRKSVV